MMQAQIVADHRRAREGFSAVLVQGVGRWSRPSPCAEWDARGVVEHVIGIHHDFLLQPTRTELDPTDDDPIARWSVTAAAIDSAIAAAQTDDRGDPPASAGVDLDRLLPALTGEVLTHTWDLAKAIGVDPQLDPELCESAYLEAISKAEQIEASGQFGASVPVSAHTDAASRLVAFFGRDPHWAN